MPKNKRMTWDTPKHKAKTLTAEDFEGAIGEALRKMLEVVAPGWRVDSVICDNEGITLHADTSDGKHVSTEGGVQF